MPKRVRHKSELPDWFSIEKYSSASMLDASRWYEQLSVRRDCFRYLLDDSGGDNNENHENEEIFKLIREAPIVDLNSNFKLKIRFLGGALFELLNKSKEPIYSLGVHSLTTRELILIAESIPVDDFANLLEWYEYINFNFDINDLRDFSHMEWVDKPVSESFRRPKQNLTPLVVNLDLPDALLVNAFKSWLKAERQKAPVSVLFKRFKKPDFSAWYQFGVLPWLDLTIWSKEANIKIPNRVLADAIFPSGEGGEETIRKTTKPMALSLIENKESDGLPLSSLAAQAAEELHNNPEGNED